jgi:aspartate carbamoyltransferase catalytic subunit
MDVLSAVLQYHMSPFRASTQVNVAHMLLFLRFVAVLTEAPPHYQLQETKQVFEKLYKYIGKDIKTLIDRTDASYVIRLQRNRVFYVREDIMRRATNVRAALPTSMRLHRLCLHVCAGVHCTSLLL